MPFSSSISYLFIWMISFIIILSNVVFPSNLETLKSPLSCGPILQQSKNPKHKVNFDETIRTIQYQVYEASLWGRASITDSSPPIYTILQCREDLAISDCQRCLAESKIELERQCPNSISGRIHQDGCFLRFDDHDFETEYLDPKHDKVECGGVKGLNNQTYDDYASWDFLRMVDTAFVNITVMAVQNHGVGMVVERRPEGLVVYALAQCWKTVSENNCLDCLVNARSKLKACDKKEAKAFYTGCYLRYSSQKFFDETAILDRTRAVVTRGVIIYISTIVGFLSALVCLGTFIGYLRLSRKRRAQKPSCSNFKYETLEKATESFNDSRKLGQGGAGSVYKGNLPDGRIVAVKRLFFNTRQWTDQFFNEVNLISGIQHKNLVRLLGLSLEGPESLLVYEYVPNRSLDQILFVKNTVHILSWRQRFSIIVGVAEGLEHLHGGSGVKIIHRDIKASNILLDQNLTPKIADFGLARSVGHDKTHTHTGIAGTLGYMAPEYLIRGQLTEKTDVYAFGVLIIELATGKKNSALTQGSNSVLYSVWKHYEANTLNRSIDPRLMERYSEEEASKVLQIGLLCVQSSVALRPSMSEIVSILKDKDCMCPNPEQPPFLSASVLMADEDTKASEVFDT